MRHLVLVATILMALGILSGCNTVQGVGKDVQAGGKAIEKAAEK